MTTESSTDSQGPLAGIRVVELAGIGPGPHAAMILADLGADVVCVRRPGFSSGPLGDSNPQLRGRRIVDADIKTEEGLAEILDLVDRADVLIEGFRPGVTERLGIGPATVLARNPGLIYGRMTGWGQEGPRHDQAGHDINYLAITGLLNAVGPADHKPVPPLNLVGDFGGGSMFLLVGILAALHERNSSGRGQIIDAAMVDGAPMLGHMVWALRSAGQWSDSRGSNLLDGGAPFYDTYECADRKFMAVGAIEPQFFAALLEGLGLDPNTLPAQHHRASWEELRAAIGERFLARSRDEWTQLFAGVDACVTPVLDFDEAAVDEHMQSREVFHEIGGVAQPAPAPRFSRSITPIPTPPPSSPVKIASIWRD
jgi:alpha-methylacyl-CoA racemase